MKGKYGWLVIPLAAAFSVAVVAVAAAVAGRRVAAEGNAAFLTVVVDAGHGGIDGGVTGTVTGAVESELNLAVSKVLRDDFKVAGFKTVMTRTGAHGLYGAAKKSLKRADMLGRKKIIEECSPNAVISIHMNKYSLSSRRGAQVFYKVGDEASREFAESIQRELNEMEEAPRVLQALPGDYFILNVSPCPAVIVECGYLSNPEDEALLVTESYREKISYTIFKGAAAYFSGYGRGLPAET